MRNGYKEYFFMFIICTFTLSTLTKSTTEYEINIIIQILRYTGIGSNVVVFRAPKATL